jgi:Predicted nucleotide-binding protein containing TIR-like domain
VPPTGRNSALPPAPACSLICSYSGQAWRSVRWKGLLMIRPRLFVGSSSEGLAVAQAIQGLLDPVAEVNVWTQGVFGLTHGTLESLVATAGSFDFAVLVLTGDDLGISRGIAKPVARDNVLFELGLFIGALGRDRTYIVYDRTDPPALPSDLAGVTVATYMPHHDNNLRAALGAACGEIEEGIRRLGIRPMAHNDSPLARVSRLAAVGIREHHIEAWALRADGRVSRSWWPNDDGEELWNEPQDFPVPGGIIDLVVGTRGPGHADVFALDNREVLWHSRWNPEQEWSGWHRFHSRGIAPPVTTCSFWDGHLEVFAVDASSGAVIHRWSNEPDKWTDDWITLDEGL